MSETSVPAKALFVLFGLFLGILMKEANKKTHFPYTPMLLIAGLIWGGLQSYLGTLGESAESWEQIDAHTILLIFIPALIFESAFGTDWHTFRRELAQTLLLAGPGVLLSTAITAVCIKYVLDYGDAFDWPAALMFGAILSATDPVAVVALLKEVGVSKRFSTLIEGESLLNDGTAMAVFAVFHQIAAGEDIEAQNVVILFLRLSLGGPLLGAAFGMALSLFIKRVFDDSVLETALTFVTCYLLFWTAETSGLHVSGILALVALGLYMSGWGKTYIWSSSEEKVHAFWSFIGWSGETLIFLLSGVIIGNEVILNQSISADDWGKLFLFFILIMIIRALVVFLFLPVLRRWGYGLSIAESLVLIYGGLRGAVGLALALIVYHNDDIDTHTRELVLFHTAGIATLTLLVNGTTTGIVVDTLGLARSSKVQDRMLQQVVHAIEEETEQAIDVLKEDESMKDADWGRVRLQSGIQRFSQHVLGSTTTGRKIRHDLVRSKTKITQQLFESKFSQIQLQISESDQIVEIRHRYLTTLKGLYWHQFEEGQVSNSSVLLLVEAADRAIDHENTAIADWEFIENYLMHNCLFRTFKKLKGIPLLGRLLNRALYHNLANAYDVASNHMSCHHHAQELMKEVIEQENEIYLDEVILEGEDQITRNLTFVKSNITDVFKEIHKDIQTKKATSTLLNKQMKSVTNHWKHGVINDNEFQTMRKYIVSKLGHLQLSQPYGTVPSKKDCLQAVRFFSEFPEKVVRAIEKSIVTKMYNPDEVLFRVGEAVSGIYVVLRGQVIESCVANGITNEYEHKTGAVAGVQHLLKKFDHNVTTGTSKSVVYVGIIPVAAFGHILAVPNIDEILWRSAAKPLILLNFDDFRDLLMQISPDQLRPFIKNCVFQAAQSGETVSVDRTTLLMQGVLVDHVPPDMELTAEQTYKRDVTRHSMDLNQALSWQGFSRSEYCVIEAQEEELTAMSDVITFAPSDQLLAKIAQHDGSISQALENTGKVQHQISMYLQRAKQARGIYRPQSLADGTLETTQRQGPQHMFPKCASVDKPTRHKYKPNHSRSITVDQSGTVDNDSYRVSDDDDISINLPINDHLDARK